MDWPEEWGGRGGTEVEKSIMEAELARADAPPVLNILGIGFLGPALIHHGSEAQRRRFIQPMLSGDRGTPGRRPLRAERPEGVDHLRPVGRLDRRPRAHRRE